MSFALCLLQNNAVPFPCLPCGGGCRTPHELFNSLCEVQLGLTSPKSQFSCLLLDLKCIFFWSAGRLFFPPVPLWFVLLWGPAQSGCSTWSLVLHEFFLLPFSANYKFLAVLAPLSLWWSFSSPQNSSCCMTAPKSTFCLGIQLSEIANLKQQPNHKLNRRINCDHGK